MIKGGAICSINDIRPKKVALLPEIDRVKRFYHLPFRTVECVSEYFLFQKKYTRTNKKRKKLLKKKRERKT